MRASQRPWAAELLYFWFHELRPNQWFGRNDDVDTALRKRFARWLNAVGTRSPDEFLSDKQTARAAILLFDQCPRNLFRGNAQAFAYDSLARAICKGALAKRWDQGLDLHERQFLYLPLMHSEAMADQLRSRQLFTSLGNAFINGFARDHYKVIARFGRFPHRNAVLGRKTTDAERRAIEAGLAW